MMRNLNLLRSLLLALLSAIALLLTATTVPAIAHEKHEKEAAEQAQRQGNQGAKDSAGSRGAPTSSHSHTDETMDPQGRDRSSLSFAVRLLDWLGRLHPTIVHFPIAFFPAALFTALISRRRQTFEAPVQFLAVAAGILAPIAAVLGWLDAMSADPSPLLTQHRWLGTGIGTAGLVLALWSWRRPRQLRSWGMIAALSVVTAAVFVQAWYGGALVHGIKHLNW